MTVNTIRVNPSAVATGLGVIAFLLVLASTAGQLAKYLLGYQSLHGFIRLFFVDSEQNIPTVFSVFLLFCSSVLLVIITLLKKQEKDRDVFRWAILAGWLLFMAIDEASSIHEELIGPMRNLLGNKSLGIFYFAWVIPGIAVVCVFALFFLGFLRRLPARTRFLFILAATLFLGGVIGIEMVGGHQAELYGQENLRYSLTATSEEGCEMAGIIVFIYAIMEYIDRSYKEIRFQFEPVNRHPRSKISKLDRIKIWRK
jgi:hypothetical protein